MRIIGSVPRDEVPADGFRPKARSVWDELVQRALIDFREGKVTVLQLDDRKDYTRMRNGTQTYWRKAGVRPEVVLVDQADGSLKVFLELIQREDMRPTIVGRPRGRPRKVAP